MDNRNCTQCSRDNRTNETCGRENYTRDNFPRNNCSDSDCDRWEIAMGYVPWQDLKDVYEPAKALRAGTLFPELEKPFMAHPMARKGARR